MENSSSPLQHTLKNVTPLFFDLTNIRWKNNWDLNLEFQMVVALRVITTSE